MYNNTKCTHRIHSRRKTSRAILPHEFVQLSPILGHPCDPKLFYRL